MTRKRILVAAALVLGLIAGHAFGDKDDLYVANTAAVEVVCFQPNPADGGLLVDIQAVIVTADAGVTFRDRVERNVPSGASRTAIMNYMDGGARTQWEQAERVQ